ncbi:MAG: serine/threonine protein phosphatase [Oscillatoria sp. SIO1A7]|nr:serine/threonine protein phosphatase [Oscillatoria sp. SIO1A7]
MTKTTDRRIFIGDVHGHYEGLMMLLEAIAPGKSDRLFFVGDLIDRGPGSSQVVKFVKQNSHSCVRGNHEQLILDAFQNNQVNPSALQAWLYSGGENTVASYSDAAALLEDVEWIRTLPLYIDLGDIWLVHAGVHPQLPIEDQGAEDFCWIRRPFHEMSQPYFPNKLIIIGHTITFTFPGVEPGELAKGKGWLGIETGAYHSKSGWLTGLDVTSRKVYQINVFVGKDSLRILSLKEAIRRIELSALATSL